MIGHTVSGYDLDYWNSGTGGLFKVKNCSPTYTWNDSGTGTAIDSEKCAYYVMKSLAGINAKMTNTCSVTDYPAMSSCSSGTDCNSVIYYMKHYSDMYHRVVAGSQWHEYVPATKTPMQRLREIMQKRQSPGIIIIDSKNPMTSRIDIREQRARETLARLLGPQKYNRFLKSGFVSVQNKYSGRVYQIFPGHKFTNVYENGKHIERLCIVFNKDFPPTDPIIMRYLLAINDEQKLWSLAVKHSVPHKSSNRAPVSVDLRTLPDILKGFKGAA